MGRFADRIARRQHPLYEEAKALLLLALEQVQEEFSGPYESLDSELIGHFETLSAEDFDFLLELAFDESKLHTDGNEAAEQLLESAHRVAETFEPDDDSPYVEGRLFVLPVVIRGRNSEEDLTLTDDQCEEIVEALQAGELLETDAAVTLLPRFLPAGLVDQMMAGDVYDLTRALAAGDTEGACEVVEALLAESDDELPGTSRDSKTTTVIAVLVGVLETDEESPFVIAKISEVEHNALPTILEEGHLEEHRTLHKDIDEHLQGVSVALKTALDVEDVTLPVPADNWYSLNDVAFILERSQIAREELQELADRHTASDLKELTIHQPFLDNRTLAYPVHKKLDDAQLGVLHWQDARDESWPQTMQRLFRLLRTLGIQPQFRVDDEDEVPEGPLH